MKKLLFAISFLLLCVENVGAVNLLLPFNGGETWECSQGNYLDKDNTASNPNPTHVNGLLKYAIDFCKVKCLGEDVLAPAAGTVLPLYNQGKWGNVVIINYGDGTFGKLAHLDTIVVGEGVYVKQGQKIGTCGGTGGWPAHIHYQTQNSNNLDGQSVELMFADVNNKQASKDGYVYTNVPQRRGLYTSLNCNNLITNYRVGRYSNGYVFENTSDVKPFSHPFASTYYHNQGSLIFGYPSSNVYLLENCIGCNSYGATKVYVQDFTGGLCGSSTLVMNRLIYNIRFNYLGVVYPIHGQLRDYWKIHFSELGAPASNEYLWNGKLVQWFEPSTNYFVSVVYDSNKKTFQQCNVSSVDCPPLVEANGTDRIKQAVEANLGCANGVCGVGGSFLSPPYNMQADTVDNQSIQLTWTLPNGTDDYNIKIYNNGVLLKNFSAIDSIIINGLSANTTYCFQTSLFCNSSGEESAKSAEVCATTNINPPPPPQNWTIANERVTTQVNSSTYQPIDEKYSYEKSVGQYLNYWVKLNSNNSGLNFEWRLFYTFDDSRVWNAQTSSNQPAYLCQKYSYFDSANQEYYIWHKIEANALLFIGQYRVELWIDGQKASSRCFDLTMPAPDYFRLNGTPTQALTSFSWLGLGDNSVSGSGVELFMDNNRIAFIPGYSNGYTIASNVRGTHDFRIREVNVYPAGTFRSPFSAPLSVMIKLNKVTGVRITN